MARLTRGRESPQWNSINTGGGGPSRVGRWAVVVIRKKARTVAATAGAVLQHVQPGAARNDTPTIPTAAQRLREP